MPEKDKEETVTQRMIGEIVRLTMDQAGESFVPLRRDAQRRAMEEAIRDEAMGIPPPEQPLIKKGTLGLAVRWACTRRGIEFVDVFFPSKDGPGKVWAISRWALKVVH